MTVITLHINNKGSRECRLPNFLKIFLFQYIASILRINLNQPVKQDYNSMFETIQKEKEEIEKLNENNICCINEFDRIFNEHFFDLMNSIILTPKQYLTSILQKNFEKCMQKN